jgi:NAD-dependent SIR2 family protein deacetylase
MFISCILFPSLQVSLCVGHFAESSVASGKCETFPAYQEVLHVLRTCKKIIVVTGAGISVSCGIPDFRSKSVGLYSSLEVADVMMDAGGSAEELFDIEFFRDNPAPFYQLAHKITPGLHRPSLTHFFIVMLAQQKKLLRNFTQNIDGLEHVAGKS